MKSKIDLLSQRVHSVFVATTKLQLYPAQPAARFNIPRWRRFADSIREVLSVARLLVMDLLEISDEQGLLRKMRAAGMSDYDVVRIITDLVLAAGDTSAFSMEWLLYAVSQNPTVAERYREVRRDAKEKDEYLGHMVKETLRMYPVAPFLTR